MGINVGAANNFTVPPSDVPSIELGIYIDLGYRSDAINLRISQKDPLRGDSSIRKN